MNVTFFSASDLNFPPAAPGADTLALWLLPVSDSGLAGLDFRHLSDREQERCARISRPEERQRYQVAHAALRRILSAYLNCPAQDLVFSANQYGKPYLSYPLDPGAGQFHFSLSHSGGYVALAFSGSSPVGVDIEQDRPSIKPAELAGRFFHPLEARRLSALPPQEQRAGFLKLWTLREAFLKGLGTGFYTPSESFAICPDRLPGVFCVREGAPEYSRWELLSLDAPEGYFLSVAYQRS